MKPHLKRTWCIGVINAIFIALMQKRTCHSVCIWVHLWLYSLRYDPEYPVVCFDERPCFLIGEVVAALPLQTGKLTKEHYSQEKNGSCCLLAAIEPLTGKRIGQVHEQGTKKEYTFFMQALAKKYPQATKISVVQHNLNTHNTSAFYEHLPAQEAFALAERFEFYYTPKPLGSI